MRGLLKRVEDGEVSRMPRREVMMVDEKARVRPATIPTLAAAPNYGPLINHVYLTREYWVP